MDAAFDDALVTGWEGLEAGSPCQIQDDRHVVAAAIRGGAQAIVTANADDFPVATLGQFGLEAVPFPTPSYWIQLDLSPPTILQVIREQSGPATPETLRLPGKTSSCYSAEARSPVSQNEIQRLMSAPLDNGT